MFCQNCGEQLLEGAKFCSKCGRKNNELEKKDTTKVAKEVKKTNIDYILTVIVATIMALSLLILPIFYLEVSKDLMNGRSHYDCETISIFGDEYTNEAKPVVEVIRTFSVFLFGIIIGIIFLVRAKRIKIASIVLGINTFLLLLMNIISNNMWHSNKSSVWETYRVGWAMGFFINVLLSGIALVYMIIRLCINYSKGIKN